MGNVFRGESPPSAYTMEYIKVKTLLVQMQKAGQGVIETLKLHRHTFDEILAENYRLAEASERKMFSFGKGSSECEKLQRQRQNIQTTMRAIEKGGVLHMESMLYSIHLLDYFISTAVRQHFSESIYQSLEETWKQAVQNVGTSIPVSMESNVDQVSGTIRPSGYDAESSVDGNDGPSRNNANLELKIMELNDELAEIRKQKDECVSDCSVKLESMKQELQVLQNQNHGLRNNIDIKQQEIDRLQSINEHNKSIGEKIEKMEKDFDVLKKEEKKLEIKIQEIQLENICLKEHLNKKKQVNLQIWFERTELLTQVAIEFQEQVNSRCHQTAGMAVNCITPATKADLKPNKPTMVLCINASRLGTDVARALDNIQWSPEVVVIVLHHKAKHALPNQSSDRVLTSPEYKQLGGIFDMAFLSGKGIYPCDMNDAALKMISEFLILASSRTS